MKKLWHARERVRAAAKRCYADYKMSTHKYEELLAREGALRFVESEHRNYHERCYADHNDFIERECTLEITRGMSVANYDHLTWVELHRSGRG